MRKRDMSEVGLDSPPLKSRKACDYYSTEKAVQLLPDSLGTLSVRALRYHVKSPTTLSLSYCKEVRPHAEVGALYRASIHQQACK